MTERAQNTTGGITYQGYIVTADDDDTLYFIGCKDASGYIETSVSQGVYNGHSYCCYTSTNYYPFFVQTASPGAVEYSACTKYKNVIFGDEYIRQHITALATEKLNISSTYIYGGSVMIVNAGLRGSESVKSFFPKIPVTVLTQVIKTVTIQGVMTEVIALLPALIPCIIVYIGLRKGLTFTLRMLKTA